MKCGASFVELWGLKFWGWGLVFRIGSLRFRIFVLRALGLGRGLNMEAVRRKHGTAFA